MSCRYTFKGKKYTEAEIIKVLSQDPDIIAEYAAQEERAGLDYKAEDLKTFQAKVKKLKESMDVEVILDPNVKTSRVLGKSDKRTKAAGKPVILINPEAIFKTTAIHEFAHIFVDSFPKGIDNPRIKRALDQLAGTDVASEVAALYPELNEEMLQKEILATAIGRAGSEIWDNAQEASKWENFKTWFFDYLRRTFGIKGFEVQRLAEDLIAGKVNKDVMSNLSLTDQEERNQFRQKDSQDELSKKETSIERVYEETLNRVMLVHSMLKPSTLEKRKTEKIRTKAGKTTRFSSITELKEALEAHETADQRKGLVKYMSWVRKEIKFMNKVIDQRKATDQVTDANLIKSLDWNNTFSMIEDIQNLLETMYRNGDVTTEERESFSEILGNIQKERSKVEASLLEMSRESYARLMAENDNKIETQYKRDYEIEYNELTDNGAKEYPITKEEYIIQQLNDNKDEIYDEAYRTSLKLAERSISDLKWHAGTLFSEKNANSRDIQVLSKLVDERELAISEFATAEATKFDKQNQAFRSLEGGTALNQKTKYDGMYETSESGQTYFASEFKPEFYEARTRAIQEANDIDSYEEKYKDAKVDAKSLKYTTSDGTSGKLSFEGAKSINVGKTTNGGAPIHVTYKKGNEQYTISVEEAIAKSEYQKWLKENTQRKVHNGTMQTIPSDQWKSDEYAKLSPEKISELNFLKGKVRQADRLYKGQKSLVRSFGTIDFIKLPSVMKSDISRISEGQTKDLLSHKFSSLIKTQADDFDDSNRVEGEEEGDLKDSVRVFADVTNKEKLRVPIPFRAKLGVKDQSLDLHSIVLMNLVNGMNHKQKTELESTFLVVLDVMKNRSTPEHTGPGSLKKIHALTDKTLYKDPKDGLSKETIKAMDILENRIYGIKNKESGKIAGVEVHKAAQSWLKYSGTIALLGNYANSIINLNMGTLSNLMEAVGGETYNMKDWKDATTEYWKDIKNITNDWGKNVSSSRTNLFMNVFNVMGGKEYLDNKFEETSKFQTLMKSHSMRPLAKSGEHMMQAKVMYAVMKSIKVMNAKGQYLDNDGKVVQGKKNAASLDKMISFQKKADGSVGMVLDPRVEATSFTSTGGSNQILLETRNLIKHKVIELHGLYDSDLQAAAQRHFMGKLLFFLRKWMIPGTLRRWRGLTSAHKDVDDLREVDTFYSQDAKANLEGYYVTAARFIINTLPKAFKEMNIEIIKTRVSEMTPREKANIRKVITELSLIAIGWTAYMALDDEDDDDKNVFAKYILRRQISELSFFLNPTESFKIASTPTAAVGTVKNILKTMVQVAPNNITEVYEQGPHKGENKAWRNTKQLIPLMNIKDTEEFKQSLKFLNNMAL